VMLPLSAVPGSLADGDLYVRDLGVPEIHAGIASALRMAVDCFRHELLVPATAMLAAAADGAWTELGATLLAAVVPDRSDDRGLARIRRSLEDEREGLPKKVSAACELYARDDLLQGLRKRCGVPPVQMKAAGEWTDVVQEARNVLHWGVEPAIANTYEKVATLLMAAVPHFRVLERVRIAARGTYDAASAASAAPRASGEGP
jgi:hypothetical protein